MKETRERSGSKIIAVLAVGLLIPLLSHVAPAGADHGQNEWAGGWDTTLGRITFTALFPEQVEENRGDGRSVGIILNGLSCPTSAKFYMGRFNNTDGSTGALGACTAAQDETELVGGFIGNDDTAGDMALRLDADGASWSGTFTTNGGGAGSWSGTFRGHFEGDNHDRDVVDDAPPPEPPKEEDLIVDWEMKPRYGKKSNDGIIRPTRVIQPERWKVTLRIKRPDGSRCKQSDVLTWVLVGGGTASLRNPKLPCLVDITTGSEKTLGLGLGLSYDGKRASASFSVPVQDWLIVGIGDSNGSGEGTPDVRRKGVTRPARWVNRRCDRSANSHQALTARALEKREKQTSVTFVHLACSGAEIETGLLKGYQGINPKKPALPPQLTELRKIAAKREVDALLISIGVNDLKFGAMVKACIIHVGCPDKTVFLKGGGTTTLRQQMAKRIARLPALYEKMAAEIKRAEIDPQRVFITQYFDSTNKGTCDPLIGVGQGPISRVFDGDETRWAYEEVLLPLNDAVEAAAARHGWNLVEGSEDLFNGHGACSKAKQKWIVDLDHTTRFQGDQNGALHANIKGNKQQTKLVQAVLFPQLYPDGETRRPEQ